MSNNRQPHYKTDDRKNSGKKISNKAFELWGWTFFIVSALFFIIASLRSGDWLSLLGGIFFLAANIVFLIPILRNSK